jgi:ubiquinone/menaquinone biosynthesis C-methylase UbiE
MNKFRDPVYLATDQYRDASNLNARIHLHERFSTNSYGWFRWLFDQIDLALILHILEVGCGSGMVWSENLARLPQYWTVILSDFSYGMVLGCRNRLTNSLGQFRFTVSDVMAIPFSSATFDVVLAHHMLYHVPDRPKALAEIDRVLKPDGTLYAATNGENHLLELDDLIRQINPSMDGLFIEKPSMQFNLENGAIQLAPWFRQVQVRRYTDSLEVTTAEPLLAYIHSMIPRWRMQPGAVEESTLAEAVHELINRQGCMHIQKASGVFIAKK